VALLKLSNSSISKGLPKYPSAAVSSTIPGEASSLVSPLTYSPALWLDSQDISTLTLSSNRVSQWNDKSGNGINFTQGDGARQPLYENSSAMSNKPSVYFDGARCMDRTGYQLFSTNSSPVTMFFATRQLLTANQNFYFTWNVSTSPGCQNTEVGYYADSTPNGVGPVHGIHRGCGQGVRTSQQTYSATEIGVFQIKSSGSAPNHVVYRSGGQPQTVLNSTTGVSYMSPGSYITSSGSFRIGGRKDSDGSGFDSIYMGHIGEIIIYKSELTTTQIENVEKYLLSRWY
jgi:hypothetical protein